MPIIFGTCITLHIMLQSINGGTMIEVVMTKQEILDKISFRLDRLYEQYELTKDSKEFVYINIDTEARIDELEGLIQFITKDKK